MSASIEVSNPATGIPLGSVPDEPAAEVAAAVARARGAQPAWAALGFAGRRRALRALAAHLVDDDELVRTLVAESGKPRHEAIGIEVFYTCELIRFFTSGAGRRALATEVRRPFLFAHKRCRVIQHPRGVVGVIGPWNWPLLNNFADAVAPLVAGNSVVLKPSPVTPLTSLRVRALWRQIGLPDGVFEVVTGGVGTGEALVNTADMIFFTGSQRGGRAIAEAAGRRLIPVVLELGGKSPMIVLEDADLGAAARAAVWSGFAHSGQVCIRTERVLVHARVHDEFVELCAAATRALRQGGPESGDVDVGAMTFAPQVPHLQEQIAEALAHGARVVTGGGPRTDLPGRFFAPTVLADVTPGMAVARDETFGPVLPVLRVKDEEDAIRVANDSPLGLAGSVWSRNEARARAVADRLQTGSACVNDVLVNYFCVEAPLGGTKQSGLGYRHGAEALRQFCRTESVVETRWWARPVVGFLRRQLGFPYQPRVLRAIRLAMRWLYGGRKRKVRS